MESYLDNSATTKPCKAAVEAVAEAMTTTFGNPSSLHNHGFAALKLLEASRAAVAKSLSAEPREIYFTPSGTVANNTAIFGAVMQNRREKKSVVTTAIEHPSVSVCMDRLEVQGFEVVRIQPDKNGHVTPEQFEEAIDQNTILVSLMAVNNEVGTILPFDKIKDMIRRKKAPALLHVDAVQGYLKLPIVPKRCGIDLLSVSAHKIHGPKGVGALYINKGVRIKPYVLGGGQEEGICSGTQGMPAIAGFAAAVGAFGSTQENLKKVTALRDELLALVSEFPGVQIHSPADALPYIVNLSLAEIPSQVSVNFLSMHGVYVSAGSACSKGHRSPVLQAMALDPKQIDSAVRISLSHETTKEEIEYCAQMLKEAVVQLRKKG